MKVAIVHDYLIEFGGAERVLLALNALYPEAPIYTLIVNKKTMGENWKDFKNLNIKTSWFNNLPFASKLISPLRFLLPLLWKGFDFSKYDLIIDSSSWAITRGFKTRQSQLEISYCHTPPRYLYGYDTSRKWQGKWWASLVKFYALFVNHFMRLYDWQVSQKVDYFLANSQNVANRIEKFYRRKSTVIYPPVEVHKKERLKPGEKTYYLTGGRLVASKNFDLIIKAFNKLGIYLKVFGQGPEEPYLKEIAEPTIEFVGKIKDEELFKYYENAKAFIVAQKDEDFGMTLVEAQAMGCPVIAFKGGGYLETVIEGKTGIFFDELNVDSLVKSIKRFERLNLREKDCIKNAQRFSIQRFKENIKKFVKEKYAGIA